MRWFSKKKHSIEPDNDMTFLIPKETTIHGNMEASIPCKVEGYIEGDVSISGTLIVGETAEITGSVTCNDITVYGKIHRDGFCNNKASVGPGGYVDGKIVAAILEIDETATVNNNSFDHVENIVFDSVVRTIISPPKAIINEDTWF
ncbi:MAG: polymer-forming cytoskeletal protein [Taibaiella sp.]|jgi:cytoskeletal protein CcmA (bactofilin family)